MDRARERAYAAGFAGPTADGRLAELEREVAALREMVTTLQADMRGVNEWVADTTQVVAVADASGCADTTCGAEGICSHGGWVDDYRAVEIATGDR